MKITFRLLLVLIITWVLARGAIYLLPGDPAEFLVQESLVQIPVQQLREQMELNHSFGERIFSFPQSVSLISHQNTWKLAL